VALFMVLQASQGLMDAHRRRESSSGVCGHQSPPPPCRHDDPDPASAKSAAPSTNGRACSRHLQCPLMCACPKPIHHPAGYSLFSSRSAIPNTFLVKGTSLEPRRRFLLDLHLIRSIRLVCAHGYLANQNLCLTSRSTLVVKSRNNDFRMWECMKRFPSNSWSIEADQKAAVMTSHLRSSSRKKLNCIAAMRPKNAEK